SANLWAIVSHRPLPGTYVASSERCRSVTPRRRRDLMEPTSAGTQWPPSGTRRRRPGPLARLDRIPVWPYERKLLWVVGAGYFFAFFDIVTISFALPVIATQFHASKSAVTVSVTSSLIGYIVGALADST